MTEPGRYSVEAAYPEWKLPVDPVEVRSDEDGQIAVRVVLFRVGYDSTPTARWVRITSHCGQLGVEWLEDGAVADWRVVSGPAPSP